MSINALADKVLRRDSTGTRRGTYSHKLSRADGMSRYSVGTFYVSFDRFPEDCKERAAIMEFDGGMTRQHIKTLHLDILKWVFRPLRARVRVNPMKGVSRSQIGE